MLVLTRKRQEQIRIGNSITLTILRIKGNTVRVGIEAPRDIRVIRGELPPKVRSTSDQDGNHDIVVHAEIGCDEAERSEATSGADEQHTDSNRLSQLVLKLRDSGEAVASAV